MEFVKIAGTEISSSRIGLGTWAMGGWLWGGSDRKECIRTIYKAFDNGVNLIDTAPIYGFGLSEEVVGEAVSQSGMRDELIIATKVGLEWERGGIFRNSLTERIRKEVDDSLRRLRTDRIDLYQIHWPDPLVPVEETAGAMTELLKSGKVRAVGVSNYSIEQMDVFRSVCPLNSSQPPYNLFEREIEDDVLPWCEEQGVTMLLYGALCRGLLSGKLKVDSEFPGDHIRNFDPKFRRPVYDNYLGAVEKLGELASERFGKNVLELSVRWVLDKCENDITLWGARRPGQLDDLAGTLGWAIDGDSMNEIDEILNTFVPNPIGPEFMAPGPRPF
jgi:aryl-alcohol dehydrogenase-like predicted oxidoreductase